MNILQINSNDKAGGAGVIAYSIKKELETRGIDTQMLVADKATSDRNVLLIKTSRFRRCLGFCFNFKNLFQTDYLLNSKEFKQADLIHFHNLHGRYFDLSTLQKMSLIKPVVWTLHDQWAITSHCAHSFENNPEHGFYNCPSADYLKKILSPEQKYIYYREKLKWLFNNQNSLKKHKQEVYSKSKLNIVVPSLWLKNRVSQSILNNQNIQLIYNGIDNKIFQRTAKGEARQKLALPIDKKIIIFAAADGKNSFYKGWNYVEKIIEFYKNNLNILFLCIGNNQQFENTENIKYLGQLNQKELGLYYSSADLFLLTSIAENFPLMPLEAMSCGLPVVSFDVGGVKEAIFHRQHGYLAKYLDTKDLINGIEYILNLDLASVEKISQACIERIAKHFTLELMINQYLELYKSLLNK